jgi:hypothetical protein
MAWITCLLISREKKEWYGEVSSQIDLEVAVRVTGSERKGNLDRDIGTRSVPSEKTAESQGARKKEQESDASRAREAPGVEHT